MEDLCPQYERENAYGYVSESTRTFRQKDYGENGTRSEQPFSTDSHKIQSRRVDRLCIVIAYRLCVNVIRYWQDRLLFICFHFFIHIPKRIRVHILHAKTPNKTQRAHSCPNSLSGSNASITNGHGNIVALPSRIIHAHIYFRTADRGGSSRLIGASAGNHGYRG